MCVQLESSEEPEEEAESWPSSDNSTSAGDDDGPLLQRSRHLLSLTNNGGGGGGINFQLCSKLCRPARCHAVTNATTGHQQPRPRSHHEGEAYVARHTARLLPSLSLTAPCPYCPVVLWTGLPWRPWWACPPPPPPRSQVPYPAARNRLIDIRRTPGGSTPTGVEPVKLPDFSQCNCR